MKLTITTLVIIEDTADKSVNESSICYHSLLEDIEKAKKEIIDDVNQVYAPDIKFETIEQIQEYFDYAHLESQEIKLISTTTAIKQI
nr:MAG: hypothetical protein [Bacteriophage sp.]